MNDPAWDNIEEKLIKIAETEIRQHIAEAQKLQPKFPLEAIKLKAAEIGLNIAQKISCLSQNKKHFLAPPTPEANVSIQEEPADSLATSVDDPHHTPVKKRKTANVMTRMTPMQKRLRKKKKNY